ncbi:MAG: thioredoxin family protein [Cyclobacteriaceae bacterium]
MRVISLIIVTVMLCLSYNTQAQIKRYSKWEQAVKKAKTDKKDILIVLTGKQWCAPCKVLEKNILSSQTFEDYAQKHLVIFEIDIPKSHLLKKNSKIVKLHEEFSARYQTPEFPSLILVDTEGNKIVDITESEWTLNEVMPILRAQ